MQPVQSIAKEAPAPASVGFPGRQPVDLRPLLAYQMTPGKRHRKEPDQTPNAIRSGQVRDLQFKAPRL